MIAALVLFGLPLRPLCDAIAQVESERGATSANVYQLRDIYIDDVNRVYKLKVPYDAKFNAKKSEKLMHLYWRYWGERYHRRTGNPVTYEVLARIHNGGPLGWSKPATVGYWERVRKQLEKGGVK